MEGAAGKAGAEPGALEVETQLRRSAPWEGARYYYLGSGSGSCYSQRNYVCHYLGVCGSDHDGAIDAFFLSTSRTWSRQCHVW